MKQLLQNLRSGATVVADVPTPQPRAGTVLIRTAASLVSAGTERTLVSFAEKNLVGKARSRPDLVRQLLDKARREGILSTLDAAFNKLDQPMPLGYSSAGTIVALGRGVEGFQVGERVACAGGGYAVHAEYALVPTNLLARIPDQVNFEQAAFTTLGAIALHGFRLAETQVGERVAIIGLGLLGLLTVSIAKAAGCAVFGVDLDPRRVELAQQLGAIATLRSQAEETARAFSRGRGCDAVLICADTKSTDPILLAGAIARDRARVVSVGAVGLDIPRKPYFEKELSFVVSRSYGPGRYDPNYEEGGHDYPAGYVRWTEGRNLEAVVDLMAAGQLDPRRLITHRYPIEQAPEAYELITGKLRQPFLGVLITYPNTETQPVYRVELPAAQSAPVQGEPGVGVLGAGNYASAVFLPVIQRTGQARRVAIASASGTNAQHAAQKFGFAYASSQESQLFDDPNIQIITLLTRHNQHARQILAAFERGKAVFCEKPLAIHPEELRSIQTALEQGSPLLTVGFNRRFAPLSIRLQDFFKDRQEPLVAHYRVNAGFLPANHWLHDPDVGGGRIIGEGCHFIDLLTWLVGALPQSVSAHMLPNAQRYREDNVVLTFTYADGSVGTVSYLANGDKAFAKERIEVFGGGRVGVLDDFRSLELIGDGKRQFIQSRFRQDKGHQAGWEAFLRAVKAGGPPPIPYAELIAVTQASFAAVAAARSQSAVTIQG